VEDVPRAAAPSPAVEAEPSPVQAAAAPAEGPPAEAPAAEPAAVAIEADEPRAVAVELGPIVVDEPTVPHRPSEEEDDADPQEVRRRIATASRSFDPDHQIRRAMDAFLSPIGSDPDRRTPDH
jgi:hypothetical protein